MLNYVHRPFLLLISALVLVFALTIVTLVGYYYSQVQQSLNISQTRLFEVKPGASSHRVLFDILESSDNPIHPLIGKMWLKLAFSDKTIKTGWYELNAEMTLEDVFSLFASGKQKQFDIALVEGLRFHQWKHILTSSPYLHDDWNSEVESKLLDQASRLFNAPISSLEGMFLADTYFFEYKKPLSEVLLRALNAMHDALFHLEQNVSLPYVLHNKYEAITLASIVEKETALSRERPLIAGVFINRLEKNMRLQTDPTVIYGLGSEFDGNLTRAHLRSPTPYNTYVIKGLPPSPIAMVGREALHAVYHYKQSDFLYFVAKGEGAHAFSHTLQEHNQAVKQYQLRDKP